MSVCNGAAAMAENEQCNTVQLDPGAVDYVLWAVGSRNLVPDWELQRGREEVLVPLVHSCRYRMD